MCDSFCSIPSQHFWLANLIKLNPLIPESYFLEVLFRLDRLSFDLYFDFCWKLALTDSAEAYGGSRGILPRKFRNFTASQVGSGAMYRSEV